MTVTSVHPMRVAVGEDDVLMQQGIVRVLRDAGFDVVTQTGNALNLLAEVLAYEPDVAVIDIRMPPHRDDDDGLRAAIEIRHRLPRSGVILLTQYCEPEFAIELIGDRPAGVGYLLKERIGDVDDFTDAVTRVAGGGTALDPEIVKRVLRPHRTSEALEVLTEAELAVLASMAEGRSNFGIARALLISQAAVEKHVTAVFRKLGLAADPSGHRRVQAVLRYLAPQAG